MILYYENMRILSNDMYLIFFNTKSISYTLQKDIP